MIKKKFKMKIDYLIKNGTIIDGSGDNRFEADILISDDQIVSILSKGQKNVKINDSIIFCNTYYSTIVIT